MGSPQSSDHDKAVEWCGRLPSIFDAAMLRGVVSMECGIEDDEDAIVRRHRESSRRSAKFDGSLVGQSADDVVDAPQCAEDSVIERCSLRLTVWRR